MYWRSLTRLPLFCENLEFKQEKLGKDSVGEIREKMGKIISWLNLTSLAEKFLVLGICIWIPQKNAHKVVVCLLATRWQLCFYHVGISYAWQFDQL